MKVLSLSLFAARVGAVDVKAVQEFVNTPCKRGECYNIKMNLQGRDERDFQIPKESVSLYSSSSFFSEYALWCQKEDEVY